MNFLRRLAYNHKIQIDLPQRKFPIKWRETRDFFYGGRGKLLTAFILYSYHRFKITFNYICITCTISKYIKAYRDHVPRICLDILEYIQTKTRHMISVGFNEIHCTKKHKKIIYTGKAETILLLPGFPMRAGASLCS